MSAERFQRLGKRVNIVIFHGRAYNYGKEADHWKIQVEFNDGGTEIKQETMHAFLDVGLDEAYYKLDQIVSKGLGASAMMPALEAPKAAIAADDIPF